MGAQDSRADLVPPQLVAHLRVVPSVEALVVTVVAHLEHLADLLFQREAPERRFRPCAITRRQTRGRKPVPASLFTGQTGIGQTDENQSNDEELNPQHPGRL
jgi:hypothetical protein